MDDQTNNTPDSIPGPDSTPLPDGEAASPAENDVNTPSPEEMMDVEAAISQEERFSLAPDATPIMQTAVSRASVVGTQRLPSLEEVYTPPSAKGLTFGHSRDIGKVRGNNEDATYTFLATQLNVENNPDFGIFIVADGAGGHDDGELASSVASRTMVEFISRKIYQPMLLQYLQPEQEPLPPMNEVLQNAVQEADERVKEQVPGGGTTLTALVLVGSLAHIAHVGDSRAYLLTLDPETNEPLLEKVTRDHSVAERLHEIGQITAEEARTHPEAGRLWKIMGLTENLEPDISTRRIPAKAHVLLCSDGLWNMVPENEIVSIILTSGTPQEATDRLVGAANNKGGLDNISVVLLKMPAED